MIKSSTILRKLLCLSGLVLAAPVFALTALALVTPVTVSGGFYLLGSILVVLGLILAFWRPRVLLMALSGLVVILAVAAVRLSLTQTKASNLKVIVLPATSGTRPLDALIDEQDSVLFGERVLHLIGGVSPREHEDIVPALSAAYREARRNTNGVYPSPFVSTYLGLQKSTAFDAIVIEPTVKSSRPVGVIFLHGFMGNVTIQCWQIAQAVDRIGALLVCPSTNWVGDWSTPDSESIVRATFRYLRGRGVQRIYLGGFSNGGNGVGSLISTLASEQELKGLIFIAGMRNAAEVRETGLPVLVIQGTDDERIPVEKARQFVEEIGEGATYVELEADHFLIMKHPRPVQEAISNWLESQEAAD